MTIRQRGVLSAESRKCLVFRRQGRALVVPQCVTRAHAGYASRGYRVRVRTPEIPGRASAGSRVTGIVITRNRVNIVLEHATRSRIRIGE